MATADTLREFLDRHVQTGMMPGAAASLGTDFEPVAVGSMALDGPPMRTDAIFRIESMTKIITSVAALRLVEDGQLGLDDPVDRWMPELAGRRVLTHPDAELDDTVATQRPITLRHLMTNQSGYGSMTSDSPLARAMQANGTASGFGPSELAAQDWLDALSDLPLAFQPGDGWRYHHSFGILGILLGRVTGGTTSDCLAQTLFEPLEIADTGFFIPSEQADRLPAAYRHEGRDYAEVQPAAGGFYTGPPPFDLSHGELVSTAADFYTFLRALLDGELIGTEHLELLRTDQVPSSAKQRDSFFYPGFWDSNGWGFGVSVVAAGPYTGRFGWSGGLSTDFFVDPDGTIGILMTQVELDELMMSVSAGFQQL
ncbi:serine hydrolase [Brevibacterium daeguense]|uniref:Serine hydrolase n=1 Tax=Brevibacterium daeguense TaxID=909936 RepID=A0ABP8EHG8_9MICO|nr:serine hydrolase domain-containing protein [Brevibacterium daeguense]